jgi:hypothetical protein
MAAYDNDNTNASEYLFRVLIDSTFNLLMTSLNLSDSKARWALFHLLTPYSTTIEDNGVNTTVFSHLKLTHSKSTWEEVDCVLNC